MSAPEELSAQARAFAAWWNAHLRVPATRPDPTQMAEWVALTTRFPSRTPVEVVPPHGPRWYGSVQDWTRPGTGRLMAIVAPSNARCSTESMHVAPQFLRLIQLDVEAR